MAACGPQPQEISRVALVAPFEGRYREVGYNALYAARLAFQDRGRSEIELLAIDDGGTVETAVDRAHALAQDPLVKAVVVLGYAATAAETQQAFGDLPVLVAGQWGTKPETENVLLLANPVLADIITAPSRVEITDVARLKTPLVGGEVFGLEQFTALEGPLAGIMIVSSGSLPEAAFRERYRASGPFTPEPNLVTTLTYQALRMVLESNMGSRADISRSLSAHFQAGYWTDAPVNTYRYDTACVERGGEMCLVAAD
ncbi:MAG TPA: hypothetical protein VHO69_16050 [Phototrophicaceae bacterium]|nr:hypothetical protein [Phototrophicaceae bacterium]